MKVYVAGPMRGIENWNREAFERAGIIWRRAGHHVFCPATVGIALGYWLKEGEDTHTLRAAPIDPEGRDHLKHVLLSDVACLMAADAIALLPGWENSTGATVEVSIAHFLALPSYDAITMQPMPITPRPWAGQLTLSPHWIGQDVDEEGMKKVREELEKVMRDYKPEPIVALAVEGPLRWQSGMPSVQNLSKQDKDIRIVSPTDHPPHPMCSHCGEPFCGTDERITTIDLTGQPLTLCRACYNNAGSNVR